ncbi:MAG: DUF6094 domain-containing protein [Chloroflexota bacterium]|nr:DUF6094 domain-containing protein [Chloroflexota bacterium]
MSGVTSNLGNLINLGYVRTPDDEAARIAALIAPAGPGPLRLADPCCGEGLALAQIKATIEGQHSVRVITYGTEADRERAEAAAGRVDQCLWSPYQDARWGQESTDVMLLNPPYTGGKTELQFLRDIQGILRPGGLLFYVIRQRYLRGPIAARLAGHFDVLAVYPFLPENFEAYDQIVVVARWREKRMDGAMKAQLATIGRNGRYRDGEQQELLPDDDKPPLPEEPALSGSTEPRPEQDEGLADVLPKGLWGYPDGPFDVAAPGGKPFYLRRRQVQPDEIATDAERFGVRTSRWWRDQVETIPELRSSTLLPLRDTQIANLLFLGFADNREFDLDGHRYLFRGQTRVIETDITSEEEQEQGRTRVLEQVQQGGVMLGLETGELRELEPAGILHLVRAHAGAFAQAVTDHVPSLRPDLVLEDWEDQVLDQVYRFKRLPGRADYGLTHVQKVIAAVTAQAIEERRTRVVVLNADTGSGKTGMAFGAALCLRQRYPERRDYEWFADPAHRGGHRRRRLAMRGSGGSARAWMRAYNHPKPFCILFAAEEHTLNKMAREAQECLPLSIVRVARDVAGVEAFVQATKGMDSAAIAVLIVPKSMSKLGSGWTWAAFRGIAADDDQVDRGLPYHCPDCGAVAVYHERDDEGVDSTYPIYEDNVEDTLARIPTWCEACCAPLWQYCRIDFRTGDPVHFSRDGFFRSDYRPNGEKRPPKVRYPVAEYIYRRYRDFFDVAVWDEAHDCNGVGTDVVAAYRFLTRAVRLGWIECTASNMNGKASGVFTRAFHASAEVRRRFRYDERAEFVNTYGIYERVTRLVREKDEAGRYTGRLRRVTSSQEAPGVQPHLTLLMVPYTVSTMIGDLGAPLPPRLEVCDEFPAEPRQPDDPFADVVAAYRLLSGFDTRDHPRARPSKFQASLAYLNAPWNAERITETVYDETTGRAKRDDEGNKITKVLLEVEPTWDPYDDRLLPKEERLLEELERALTEGHGISVMIAHIERGLQDRLAWLTRRYLGQPAVRYCTADAQRRERWYARCVRDGVKVIISHPGKLETGLDLIHYPWIYFYQPVTNLYTMIQAKGRAWRLGQEWACETHFWYYADTEEHALLQLQADKMIADNLLRGGELAGGLMDMGRQLNSVEMTRAALREGDLRHLGVLLQQGAIGEWLSREEIAARDRERARARREQREAERARGLRTLESSFQMALPMG